MPRKKRQEPGRPECYKAYAREEKCVDCPSLVACRLQSGKKNRDRAKTPSRKMAIKAFCKSCNGGSARSGCPDFCCPFYVYLPAHRQLCGDPVLWWDGVPISGWEAAEQEARLEKRVARVQSPEELEGPEEDDDAEGDDE